MDIHKSNILNKSNDIIGNKTAPLIDLQLY